MSRDVTEAVAERAWRAMVPRGRSLVRRPSGGRYISPRSVEYRKREIQSAPHLSIMDAS